MFKDYIVYDNILDNPDNLLNLSKEIEYYSADDRTIPGAQMAKDDFLKPGGGWRGLRSKHFQLIDSTLFENTMNEIIFKTFGLQCDWEYNINAYLHLAPGYIEYDDMWWHIDTSSMVAGVIYLNQNPEKDSGTMLIKDNEEIKIDNVYNRLVMYKSHLMHRPMKCFGDNIDNSRLIFIFFIEKLLLYRRDHSHHSDWDNR